MEKIKKMVCPECGCKLNKCRDHKTYMCTNCDYSYTKNSVKRKRSGWSPRNNR